MSILKLPETKRKLGNSGIEISPIAWGMWRFAEDNRSVAEAAQLVHAALDADISLFDTADIYGFDGSGGFGDSEALLGQIFAADKGLRSHIVLASKGGIRPPLPYDQSPKYLAEAIDASLRRMQVDVIDLYQIHRPDILSHPQDVARTLEDAVTAGKIRAIGVSNYTLAQTEALAEFLNISLVSVQPEISPLQIDCFENGTLDQAMRMDMVPLAWSPLSGGQLVNPITEREQAVAAELDRAAKAKGMSRSVAAYSWLMAHPSGIVPIIGSQNAARIAEGAEALTMRWTREDWYAVFVAARGEELP